MHTPIPIQLPGSSSLMSSVLHIVTKMARKPAAGSQSPVDSSSDPVWCSHCGLPIELSAAYGERAALGLKACIAQHNVIA